MQILPRFPNPSALMNRKTHTCCQGADGEARCLIADQRRFCKGHRYILKAIYTRHLSGKGVGIGRLKDALRPIWPILRVAKLSHWFPSAF